MKDLVFVHGRSQQNKDAATLKQEWIEAFAKGLKLSGLDLPIDESAIHFPYYGDTLDQLVAGKKQDEVARIVIKGDDNDQIEKEFQFEILQEIWTKAGLTDEQAISLANINVNEKGVLNWAWVQAILSGLDRYVPFGSSSSVAIFTKDVYQYVTKTGLRNSINSGVKQAIPRKPTVVIAHSLGSIVAYDVLRQAEDADGWDIPLFVTVGCPLGITCIRNQLKPNRHPTCVGKWFNAMDERDVVALYPLNKKSGWGISPAIENKTDVDNQTSNRHGIAGYLSDPVVARRIYDSLKS